MPSTKKKRGANNKKKRRDQGNQKTSTISRSTTSTNSDPPQLIGGRRTGESFYHYTFQQEVCNHGCPPPPVDDPIFISLVHQFMHKMSDSEKLTKAGMGHQIWTELLGEPLYQDILLNNDEKRRDIKDFWVAMGVNFILGADPKKREMSSTGKLLAPYLLRFAVALAEALLNLEAYEDFFSHEAYLAGSESSSERYDRWLCRKLRDLNGGCERTVIRVFAKRAPCSCLEDQLARVNQQPKIGACSWCRQQFEYQSLMKCDRCTLPHYCSRACQVNHWPEHKNVCKPKVRQRKPAAGQDEEEEDLEEIL